MKNDLFDDFLKTAMVAGNSYIHAEVLNLIESVFKCNVEK